MGEEKIEVPSDIPVEMNTQKGVLWRKLHKQYEGEVEMNKINAELNQVISEYCLKKAEEDSESVKKELEGKKK